MDGILFIVLRVLGDRFFGRFVMWGLVISILLDLIIDVEIVILFKVEILVGEKLGLGWEELGVVLELNEEVRGEEVRGWRDGVEEVVKLRKEIWCNVKWVVMIKFLLV